MKKLLAVLVLVLFGTMSYAQWVYNAPHETLMGGNVGVGTTAPAQVFHGYSATNATLRLESGYTGTALQTLAQFQGQAANGQRFIMAFRHNAGGYKDMLQSCQISPTYFAEFMYFRFDTQKWEMRPGVFEAEFQNQGNVSFNNTGGVAIGMGTYAIPSGAKVAVGGKIVAKEIEVTLTGMPPDFVFNSDYKLASLYDVENFINTNKHLPGVPSASEMTTKGVNVGDMNMTLLQKVEELTLYMINLQKENDALKARVSNLEK